MVDRLDETRKSFEADRKKLRAEMGRALGIDITDAEAMMETYGEGMKNGQVRFEPRSGKPNTFGVLHYTAEEGGRRVSKTREITNLSEAALLTALQSEANSSRK